MIEVRFQLVKPDKEDQIRDWMKSLVDREDEVQQTFAQEGVRAEKAWLLRTPGALILAYAIQADDIEHAYTAARASTIPLDAEHQAIMREIDAGPIDAELIWNMAGTWDT